MWAILILLVAALMLVFFNVVTFYSARAMEMPQESSQSLQREKPLEKLEKLCKKVAAEYDEVVIAINGIPGRDNVITAYQNFNRYFFTYINIVKLKDLQETANNLMKALTTRLQNALTQIPPVTSGDTQRVERVLKLLHKIEKVIKNLE
jgi:hypothetical protein